MNWKNFTAKNNVAVFALEHRTTTDAKEQAWQEIEFTVIYRALYGLRLRQGIAQNVARQKVVGEVRG